MAGSASAQLADRAAAGSNAFRVDIAVPEAPALLLTAGDANSLLRPSTVRDFSAAFSDFTDEEGRFTLPASFAVEIAPRLLFFGRGLTVQRYAGLPADIDIPVRKDSGAGLVYPAEPAANLVTRAWSTLRVSLATHRLEGQDQPTKIALGFRTSPINDADPRLNTNYRRAIRTLLAGRNRLNTEIAQNRCQIKPGLEPPAADAPMPPGYVPPSLDPGVALAQCLVAPAPVPPTPVQELIARRDAVQDSIVAARRAFAEDNWNQNTLEFAGAFSLAARDSTGRSPRPAEYAAWGTYTHPLASWAQGLLGARFRSARDTVSDERQAEWLLGGRLYMGRNNAKALVEAQLPLGDELDTQPYAGLGVEARILPELWATFSAGVERHDDARASRLVTRFSIRSGKPNLQQPEPTLAQRTP
jgi:hypothetical protein